MPFYRYPIGSYVWDSRAIYRVAAHLDLPLWGAWSSRRSYFLALEHVCGYPCHVVTGYEDAGGVVAGELPVQYTRASVGMISHGAPIPASEIMYTYVAGVDIYHTHTRVLAIVGHDSGDESVGMQGFSFSYVPTLDFDESEDEDYDAIVGAWLYHNTNCR